MVEDVTPLPDQEAIQEDVARVRYHFKIDLTDMYEQVHVYVEDVDKNAFMTITGIFVRHITVCG